MKKKFFDDFEIVKMSRNSIVVIERGKTNSPENCIFVGRNAFNKICEDKAVDWTVIKKQLNEYGPEMQWLEVLAWQ